MDERNQADPGAEATPPAGHAPGGSAFEPASPFAADAGAIPAPVEGGEPRPADPFAAAVFAPPPRLGSDAKRGLVAWLLILVVGGIGGLAVGMVELSLLVALAGLFIAAQTADLDRRFRWFYWMLTWVVPVGSFACFAGLGYLAMSSAALPATRTLVAAFSGAAGIACLLIALRPIGDPIAVRLFHEDPPTHALRLTMRLAAAGILLAIPGAVLLRDQFADLMKGDQPLLTGSALSGQLIGMVVLALAGVGFLVRRDWRATFARLGLQPLTLFHLLVAVVGAGVLFLFNSGADRLQHAWFPDLWADDRAMVDMMAKGMGGPQALLLGVSAGVGEELTMRGALQPRLGLVLTSLLFAALHVQYSWFGMLVILALGLILGGIRARTSTSVAILVHALYDILAVVTN